MYLGLTNGDLADPLGYGPLFARGNSNRYVDSTGRFSLTAGGAAAAAAAAAANPVLDAVVLASAATTGAAIYVTHAFKHSEQGQALAESNKQRFGSFVRGVKALVTSAAAEGGEQDLEYGDYTANGTPITEHGGDQMEERGFTGEDVDGILEADPKGTWQKNKGTYKHVGPNDNVVITNLDGAVVTVYGKDNPGPPEGKKNE